MNRRAFIQSIVGLIAMPSAPLAEPTRYAVGAFIGPGGECQTIYADLRDHVHGTSWTATARPT